MLLCDKLDHDEVWVMWVVVAVRHDDGCSDNLCAYAPIIASIIVVIFWAQESL